MADPDTSLRDLAVQKEREWREVQELRVQALEEAVREKDQKLADSQARFQMLKDDFKYNLRLLAERDQELEHYDTVFSELKAAYQAKNAEVSELKICIDELRKTAGREAQAKDDLQRHYQKRIQDRQQEVEKYKLVKDAELEAERGNLSNLKRNLQRQLREVKEELDIQRQELSAGFDEAMRRRENEYRAQLDDMNATVLAHEMKVKLLSKELELVRTANERASSQLGDADSAVHELQKQLKQREWELHDQVSLKDARIAELESQKEMMEQSVNRAMEDFNRKHAELDKYNREKQATVLKLKDSHNEAERQLQDKIRELNAKMEASEAERRREEWSYQDAIKEKDLLVDKLQREVQDVRSHSDTQLANASRDTVNKDLVITGLRETQGKLSAELEQRKQDAERYKKQLSLAAEREANLERSRTQAELDWQRRCEELERQQYSKSEELIQRLTTARDEALATVKEKDREISQREDYIRVLTADRDHAFATLRKHKLQINRDLLPNKEDLDDRSDFASEQLRTLQEQNDMLRAVIHEMREDMERLGETQPAANQSPDSIAAGDGGKNNPPITEDYVKILEKESRDLKLKLRELEEKYEAQREASRGNETNRHIVDQKSDVAMDNSYIRSHVQTLNDTIGALRSEKVTLSAQVKRQQARITHLESNMNQLQKQPYEKQTEIEELQYELTTAARRHASETASLRKRVAELELQLAETRREADEYYKGGLQTNLEATALGNQVSALKMDLISQKPVITGTQPALVHQLQDEIHSLKKQLAAKSQGESELVLRAKLKDAARHISRLATERQQLIQLGNKLRSELARYTGPVQGPKGPGTAGYREGTATAGQLAHDISGKLSNLEKLQYALTKQELQYAHRGMQRDQETTEVIQVQLNSSSSESPPETEQEMQQRGPSQRRSAEPHPSGPTVPAQPSNQSHESPGGSSKESVPLMMSSYGGESLQDVWQILDEGRSPTFMRSPTPQALRYYGTDKFGPVSSIPDQRQHRDTDSDLGIAGTGTSLQARPTQDKNKITRAVGRSQPKRTPQKARQKVRNYNIKDNGTK
ncbi:coiled-coil domain-containing protein 57-like [Acanthaster planci]|uniref:Coiled-coil domain-containing protein 57-like n=1 Tax=Acanthaster planci TaxID=133434 RepID=A0A8B7XXE7_ACAPL|nr:coiled-coil domain-containing protein 57-like [Acanthaster planci]XP_022084932.1 coiled-coil domain-containing protein 57-like [Acanthaster planci]